MNKVDIKLFRRWDAAVFAAILALALTLFSLGLGKGSGSALVISVDGKETEYSLKTDTDIPIESEGVALTVTVKNGEVWVSETTCENAICSHSGKISKEGQIIVCAPARVSIRLVGNEGGDYDAVAG